MIVGYPKDENKRQVWNGSGMAALTPARRKEIGEKSAKKAKARREGWPENTQGKRWDKETLEACSWEWARLMANSRRAHW